LMTASFGTHPKRRLNRVLDVLNFDYPDYEQLGGDAEGPKRKRIASALDKESTKLAKKEKEISEKLSPEPKMAAPRKRKAAPPKLASPKPKTSAREEEAPATPSATKVEEILKVMTEPLPVKLSPLATELTKFFQKDKEASAAESPTKPKKRRIIQVADVIHQTPPPTSASKIVTAETTGAEATGATTEAEATGAETGTTEDPNLETTCRRFETGGSLDRRVNCRRVPQSRWVGARQSAKGGRQPEGDERERWKSHGLHVCPAPRSGSLAVGGYKRPRGRERAASRERLSRPFPARPTLYKRALVLPFIGARSGSRCTMGGVAMC
jgi:hypothetical protein